MKRVLEAVYGCGVHPCIPLFRNAPDPGSYFALTTAEKARFIVLEDVEGKRVTTGLTAPTVEFDDYLSRAQKVLDTVKATVTYDAATKRAVLDPSTNLKRGVAYRAVVSTGARDLSGNLLDQDQDPSNGNQPKVWFFTVPN